MSWLSLPTLYCSSKQSRTAVEPLFGSAVSSGGGFQRHRRGLSRQPLLDAPGREASFPLCVGQNFFHLPFPQRQHSEVIREFMWLLKKFRADLREGGAGNFEKN